MKKFKKILGLVTVLMLALVILPTSVFAAGSYVVSASAKTITVGKTATLTITAKECAGQFTVTSSNPSVATVNKSSLWIDGSHENASSKVTIKAVATGTTTITINPKNVSDQQYNLITTPKTITITVKKAEANTNNTTVAKSSDATLKSMTTDLVDLAFNKNTTNYTVNVNKTVTSLGLKAAANSSKATVKITGDEGFVVGENTVKVVVTAENGTTKTYTIKVVKSKYERVPLLDLDVKGYKISPEFEPDKFLYELDVVAKNSIEVEYVLADEDTKVAIEGADNLKIGENEVRVVVTEEDGIITTYALKVNVAPSADEVKQSTSIWIIVVIILALAIAAETVYMIIKNKKTNQKRK